jgi:glycine cleavage system H protein
MATAIDPTALYTSTHEWLRVDGDSALAGITDYAQHQLSDIVYVELPEVGGSFDAGAVFCTVESVKAASDCYLAVGGSIMAINEALVDHPDLINSDPYGEGWLVRVRIADLAPLAGLMTPSAYAAFVERAEQEGH